MSEEGYLSSTDVKQYVYCPKVIYFLHVLHLYERQTESMFYGKEIHDETVVAPLIPRLKVEKVLKNIELRSKRLKLKGKIDFILITKFKEYIPVEVKWVSEKVNKPAFRHKSQLISIAILIEENYETIVKRGIIYYVNEKKTFEVIIRDSDKKIVKEILKNSWTIINKEINPEVDQPISKCKNCGFKQFCRPYL